MIMEVYTRNNKRTLALGFVGTGWIGRNRMGVLLSSGIATAAAIAEPYPEHAAQALEMAPEAEIMEEASEIYQNTDIDGVVIATPSALHACQALEALNAGKAVFCQKPLGRTAGEVESIVAASRRADQYLSVDLSYRYTRAFEEIYKIVSSGKIGKVYAVDLVFHNAYGPDKEWFYDLNQSGGGCVMDLGIHMIDLALLSLGFPDTHVISSILFSKGEVVGPQEGKVEDYAKVTLQTSEGTTIGLDCSWHSPAGREAVIEAVFYGTQGGAAFKNSNGSFYDFTAERYNGTTTEVIETGPDAWSGRAGIAWAMQVLGGAGYDAIGAAEYLKTAKIIDSIYGR